LLPSTQRGVVRPIAVATSQEDGRPLGESHYRHDLQGLRAVAVLLVALDHAGVSFLRGGFVGVDVFFVLSGFLITGLLLGGASKRGYVSLLDFYSRRARRILPAAALTLVATMIAANYLLNYVRAKEVVWDSVWSGLFAANIRFAQQGTDYFARGQPPSAVQHYWSLAVEEQFYLVWPALVSVALFGLVVGGRARRRRLATTQAPLVTGSAKRRLLGVTLIAATASLAWSIYYTGVVPTAAYFSPFTRAWELAIGAALALGTLRISRAPRVLRVLLGWSGLLAIALAAVTFSGTTPFPGYAALLPTLGAGLVIAAGTGNQRSRLFASRALAVAPLRYVGDRSYAFYLWHWPVLTITVLYEGHDLGVGMKLLLLLGAFLVSIVSYRFFENPIRRARWSAPTSALLVPVSVAAVIVVSLLTLSSINAKIAHVEGASAAVAPARSLLPQAPHVAKSAVLPGVVVAVKAARRGAKLPAGLTPPPSGLLAEAYKFPDGCVPASDDQTTTDLCHLGDTTAAKTIVVFGDSHAQMWMPTILAMAQADAWVVIPIVKSGCVPSVWTGKGFANTSGATRVACHAWYRWAVGQAKSLHPDVTLIGGCCGGDCCSTATATKTAFSSLATTMKAASKNVIVLADDDGISKQPVDCLLASGATMKSCTTTATAARYALNDDLARLAKLRRFSLLKTRGWFCYQSQCPMVVGHTIVYRDTGHITQAYARQLAAPFRAAFRRCIFDACPG
jgi:peptidoglycan/LPS O-acetylase OafA/YrhL